MVELGLSPSAREDLAWAEKKMTLERQAEELAKNNVTVKDALDNYQQRITEAEQQLRTVVALVQ
jgi:prefoldin subunit 5